MPLSAVQVGLAVSNGVSIVCATCERYWAGRDRGLPEPKCTTQVQCGSPLAGQTFPDYKGPITQFDRWCFVCGAASKYGVRVGSDIRVFGMCAEHVSLVETLRPVGLNGVPYRQVIASSQADAAKLLRVPKKSLAAAIAEVEQYYATKDGSGD